MNTNTANRSLNKKLAIIGALGALTVLFGLLPVIGYIRLPWGLAITLLHIPTILGALIAGPIAVPVLVLFLDSPVSTKHHKVLVDLIFFL